MTHRAIAIVQARMTSTRLPGKVVLPLAGRPMVQRVMERVARTPGLAGVCLAIPTGPAHRPLADLARAEGWMLADGPEDDVLKRYWLAAQACNADTIMRVTSDCPLIDPDVCGTVLGMALASNAPYARTSVETGYPLGLDVEVVSAAALMAAEAEATDPYEREHVTPFIWRRQERFGNLMLDRLPNRRNWRLTVDEPADYKMAERIYNEAFPSHPNFDFKWLEGFLLARPDVLAINAHIAKPDHRGWTKS